MPTPSTDGTTGQRPAKPALQVRLLADLAGLTPAYFGLVMATGIVSIAAHLQGWSQIARTLFYLNNVMYAALWLLSLGRLLWFPKRFFSDLIDHLRGPGFFTLVAGTGMLGAQYVLLLADYRTGLLLWVVALVLWIGLTYAIFTSFTVKEQKPSLDKGISGAWLLAVVATQSVAVLGAMLAAHVAQPYRLEMNFLALSMWLWGGMLYIWMMSLIFYRYTFFRFSPGDLSPPYWINMGAMAISTLAGSLLIINAPDAPFLLSLLPFLKGFTVFYWATGTWWIPMLVLLSIWRHIYKRFPMRYDPLYWGAVFPLGMYATGTQQMLYAMEFELLKFLPRLFLIVALVTWSIAFIGLLRDLLRRFDWLSALPPLNEDHL
ncbi:MAG: tellurite resistance/C4-dicarboxylate transporter family protein [Polaromonas sp.]